MDIRFRTMTVEPKWRRVGSHCNVRASYDKAIRSLRHELTQIGATDVVIEAGFSDSDLRNDGLPRATVRPRFSTVRVTFKKGGTPLSFVAGGHADYTQNVYLVSKTLEALRAVDRYGCTQANEQYKGWAQLPPGGGSVAVVEWSSVDAARTWMADLVVLPFGTPVRKLFIEASKMAHPDAGGSDELMSQVNRARDYIEANTRGVG